MLMRGAGRAAPRRPRGAQGRCAPYGGDGERAAIVVTLGEQRARAEFEPADVRASRRRAIVRRMQRLPSFQRERDLAELGYRDLGGEG